MDNQPTPRWKHLSSAIRLAIQRSAHKWTFEDFCECFPIYAKEEGKAAASLFNLLSSHHENDLTKAIEAIFEKYETQKHVDALHRMIQDAKSRKSRGEASKDVWKEDLEPRASVRARTVPLLEKETAKLRNVLDQMDKENLELERQLVEEVRLRDGICDEMEETLDKADKWHNELKDLPWDDFEAWMVQLIETSGAARTTI